MKKILIAAAAVMALASCEGLGKRLANGVSRMGSFTLAQDIVYGDDAHQKLDVYTPKHAKNSPVVIFIHGGNWATGSKDEYVFLAEALTSKGVTVIIPDYSKYPDHKFPSFIEDAAGALAWAHSNVENHGGNPDNIYLMGHSAGAYIAALATLDESYIKAKGGSQNWIKGMIGLAGPYNFVLDEDYLHDIFGEADYPRSQPIYFARGDAPPMLMMHGKQDTTVGIYHSVNMEKKIQKLGGDVSAHYYDMDHRDIVAAFAIPFRYTKPVLDDVMSFISERSQKGQHPPAANPQ